MRLVRLEHLRPGARLARDIWTGASGATPLLRAGTTLSARYVRRLGEMGIGAVYVADALSEGIEVSDVICERTRQEAAHMLERTLRDLPAALAGEETVPCDVVWELKTVVERIVDEVTAVPDTLLALADLATSDAYTVQHSIDVTVLGLLIGRRLFQEQGWIDHRRERRFDGWNERLRLLGLGLMLHDIGKALIPRTLLTKEGPLDEDEWKLMKQHTVLGADILDPTVVSPLVRSVVRSHHERLDGSGYPDGLRNDAIPLLARIAAVADVFDAMTSARPYRPAQPTWEAYDEIVGSAGRLFDPEIVSMFRKVVSPYPPGTAVALSDGRRGIVSKVPPHAPARPVVRVLYEGDRPVSPIEVRLADEPALTVSPLAELEPAAGADATGITCAA